MPQRNPPQRSEDQISTGHMLERQEMNEDSTFKVESVYNANFIALICFIKQRYLKQV